MNILIDISHPAHVHFFRNAIEEWGNRGNNIFITARDKDITLDLLKNYGFRFSCLTKAKRGVKGLFLELLEHQRKLHPIIKSFHPDIMLQISGAFIVHIGKILRIPTILFTDTENAKVSNLISFPFASMICVPSCYSENIKRKHVRYNGYHELAYLHPNRFSPDPLILSKVGLSQQDIFFVIRFVDWESGHDIGLSGFSENGKRRLISELIKYGSPLITSEGFLPPEYEKYRITVPPEEIHHLLYYSTLCIGESATMASESAMLGTPAIFFSPVGRGYTDDEEKRYDLCYTFHPTQEEEAIGKIVSLIKKGNLKTEWKNKRERMLKDKIDVTEWLVEFVEDFVKRYKEKNI
ncbi:MAG: DUF354 domain-containing protein [Nitrospirota bacterium]